MILCNTSSCVNLSLLLPFPALNLGRLEYILSDSRSNGLLGGLS